MIGWGEELDVTARMIVLMLMHSDVTSLTETSVPMQDIVVAVFLRWVSSTLRSSLIRVLKTQALSKAMAA
jgi:hypothetical protein